MAEIHASRVERKVEDKAVKEAEEGGKLCARRHRVRRKGRNRQQNRRVELVKK